MSNNDHKINSKEDAWVEWVSSFLNLIEVEVFESSGSVDLPIAQATRSMLNEARAKIDKILELREKREKITRAVMLFSADVSVPGERLLQLKSKDLRVIASNSLDYIRRNNRIYMSQCDDIVEEYLSQLGQLSISKHQMLYEKIVTMRSEFHRVTLGLF